MFAEYALAGVWEQGKEDKSKMPRAVHLLVKDEQVQKESPGLWRQTERKRHFALWPPLPY